MSSIGFQSDQDLCTDARTKNSHYSHARPKTKASAQLVSIADYMGVSLEMNDSHTIKNFKHTDKHITYKEKTNLYTTFDNARA